MSLIYCPACHNHISANASACPKCGNPIDVGASSPALQKSIAKSKVKVFLVSAVLFVALCAGIRYGIVYLLNSGSPEGKAIEYGTYVLECVDLYLAGEIEVEDALVVIREHLAELKPYENSKNEYEADIWTYSRDVYGNMSVLDSSDVAGLEKASRDKLENSRYSLSMAIRRANIKGDKN